MLDKYNGKPMPSGNLKTERKTGNLLKSPFEFKRYGQSGIEVSEIFPKLGAWRTTSVSFDRCTRIGRITSLRSFYVNCGEKLPGRPAMGSWLTYGLGTENQNLPGFVVLCPGLPVLGHALWSSTFLPAVHQGTYLPLGEKDPKKLIEHIRNQHASPKTSSAKNSTCLET